MALNILAGIAAIPVGLLFEFATGGFEHASRATWHETASYPYIAAFVFGQSFLIGRWYDRGRGSLPPSSTIPVLRTSRIVHVVALVGSLFFICFGIWHMLHNGWTSTWITGAGVAAWGSIASIAVVLRLRWLFRSSGRMLPTNPLGHPADVNAATFGAPPCSTSMRPRLLIYALASLLLLVLHAPVRAMVSLFSDFHEL